MKMISPVYSGHVILGKHPKSSEGLGRDEEDEKKAIVGAAIAIQSGGAQYPRRGACACFLLWTSFPTAVGMISPGVKDLKYALLDSHPSKVNEESKG